jgi:membrane protease YdiL (CAAX protease family)
MISDPLPKHVWLSLAGALIAFSLIFMWLSPLFWAQLAATVLALGATAFVMDKDGMHDELSRPPHYWLFTIVAGLASAFILYIVFVIANAVARQLFAFASDQIGSVYLLKAGKSRLVIGLLIALIIAPGEELFWRAYVQRHMTSRFGVLGAVIVALVYGMAHAASGNLMLVLAAMVCGVFWGAMYYFGRSLWLNIISHAAWDLAIFVLFPLM